MNYQVHYNNLISKAQSRILESTIYTERHHIVPRCIGGSDDSCNLVDLLPEEHLVAHLLLHKIHPNNNSLLYAANMMTNFKRTGSTQYGWLKRKFSKAQKGKTQIVTEETKRKQRATWKKKYENGYVSPSKNRSLSSKTRKKISEANKGKTIDVKYRSSLEGYVLRYGEKIGKIKYQEDCKKKGSSLKSMIYKYGKKEGTKRYNKKVETTRQVHTGRQKTDTEIQNIKKSLLSYYESHEHNSKNTFWITDGKTNKRCNGDIPKGFKKGRVFDKQRKPSKPPMTIYDSDNNPVMTILSRYQKTMVSLGLPKKLYDTVLDNSRLFEDSRPCDITRLTKSGNIRYKGWYAKYVE